MKEKYEGNFMIFSFTWLSEIIYMFLKLIFKTKLFKGRHTILVAFFIK